MLWDTSLVINYLCMSRGVRLGWFDRGSAQASALVVAGLLAPTAAQAQSMGEHTVLATIGSLDGPAIETFGHIADAALLPDGRAIVLDSQSGTVTWFDPANGERGRVARRGEGPGEVIRPHRATIDERGRLHVLDLGLSRLSTFEPAEGSARFTESRPLASAVYDICVLDGELYALVTRSSGIFARLDERGRLDAGFGPSFHTGLGDRWPFDHYDVRIDQGVIACDVERRRVIVASVLFGIVKAVDLDGGVAWSTALSDFTGVALGPVPGHGGCCIYKPVGDDGRIGQVTAIAFVDGELVVSLASTDVGGDDYVIEHRWLDPETGAPLARTYASASIVDATGATALGVRQLPVPQVVVFQMPPGR